MPKITTSAGPSGPGAAAAASSFLRQDGAVVPRLPTDQTGTDIQPVGNQATGSTGLYADAGHVHPSGWFQPADVGLIAWNFDPLSYTASTAAGNGTIYMEQIILRTPATITYGCFNIATGATTPTTNENFLALVDSTGTIQASTAAGAIDTATATSGYLKQAFSAPYAAPAGKYYLAVLLNASSPLHFGALTLQASLGAEAGVATASQWRFAVNGTSASALPTGSPQFTLSSNVHTNAIAFSAGLA